MKNPNSVGKANMEEIINSMPPAVTLALLPVLRNAIPARPSAINISPNIINGTDQKNMKGPSVTARPDGANAAKANTAISSSSADNWNTKPASDIAIATRGLGEFMLSLSTKRLNIHFPPAHHGFKIKLIN
jgi:hypothetical protein